MEQKRKRIRAFVAGCIAGIVLLAPLEFLGRILPNFVVDILLIPAEVGYLISRAIIWPICQLNISDLCIGLSFDGGPLQFIEWGGFLGGQTLGYGAVFLLIYEIYFRMNR